MYTTENNLIDFNVDDNGLWIIYSAVQSNNTFVAKLDSNSLEFQYSWNISINHHKVGEMFIVCGVLYAVDSVTERLTKIRLALDLYQSKLLEVNLSFTNPFRKTTTVGYNHRNKVCSHIEETKKNIIKTISFLRSFIPGTKEIS